jgi:hypothetical protein
LNNRSSYQCEERENYTRKSSKAIRHRRQRASATAYVAILVALPAGSGYATAGSDTAKNTLSPSDIERARNYFTDRELTTHEGGKVRFYPDVLDGRIVMINVMYTNAPCYLNAMLKIVSFATSVNREETNCGSAGAPGNGEIGRDWMRDSSENCANPP